MTEALIGILSLLAVSQFVFYVKEQKVLCTNLQTLTTLMFGRTKVNGFTNNPTPPLLFRIDKIEKDVNEVKKRLENWERWYVDKPKNSKSDSDS